MSRSCGQRLSADGVAGVGERTLVLTTPAAVGQGGDAAQRSSLPNISPTIVTTPGS